MSVTPNAGAGEGAGVEQAVRGVPIPFPPEQSKLSTLITYRGDPLLRFADLRDRYPEAVGFELLNRRIIVLHDPEAIEDVLVKKHSCFVKDQFTVQLSDVLGNGLLTASGEQHKRHRKLVAPYLAAPEVAGYAPTMLARARDFALRHEDGEVIDVSAGMMHLTLDILVRTLFGHEFSEFELVERELDAVMKAFRPRQELLRSLVPKWVPLPSRRRLARARRVLHGVVDRLIAEKRASPTHSDLLSRLIAARDEGGGLSDEELRDEVLTLFMAGHETTALSLTYVLRLLALHPECRAKVEAELDAAFAQGATELEAPDLAKQLRDLPYTHAVFQEALRLYPPAWVIGRQAVEACTIGRWALPEGAQVFVSIYTLQRHPKWFEQPEAFMPERFLPGGSAVDKKLPRFVYAPFGGGPRVCVGAHFALLEAMAVLCGLLSQSRFERIDAPFGLSPSVTLRPAHAVPMRIVRRRP